VLKDDALFVEDAPNPREVTLARVRISLLNVSPEEIGRKPIKAQDDNPPHRSRRRSRAVLGSEWPDPHPLCEEGEQKDADRASRARHVES
jgi:hypothetical protein